jgi:hypothetical protein
MFPALIRRCDDLPAKITMMHGSTKLKFSDAKQARDKYNYKNIKRKLYRTNTAFWQNKICRQKQLTPAYINIRIKGKNQH